MSNHKALEEGSQLTLDFKKLQKVANCGQDVIPAVAQDIDSKEVLIVGFVNQEALNHALEKKVATFWSTSRNELWIKGATSGEFLELIETRVNCEQNSVLYLVKITSEGACHTKGDDGKPRLGCYYRRIDSNNNLQFIS